MTVMLNSHCNDNDKKKKKKNMRKNMWSSRFKPRIYGFTDHRGIHYTVEASGIN